MSTESSTVSVDGKRAVVIGGTTGIGRAIALAFAADGADVIATSRSEESVTAITEELRAAGAKTTEITCDVTDRRSIEALHESARETFGGVDVLVNSAGGGEHDSIQSMSESTWANAIDVYLTGVFRACQVFGRTMDDGSIINVSSMSADQARGERPAYCAAKSGVNGLTRSAAVDLAPEVRINAIAPGFVRTELSGERLDVGSPIRESIDERTPMSRIGQANEIAGAAVYLASDAASFTTGEVITVDGGYDKSAL